MTEFCWGRRVTSTVVGRLENFYAMEIDRWREGKVQEEETGREAQSTCGYHVCVPRQHR